MAHSRGLGARGGPGGHWALCTRHLRHPNPFHVRIASPHHRERRRSACALGVAALWRRGAREAAVLRRRLLRTVPSLVLRTVQCSCSSCCPCPTDASERSRDPRDPLTRASARGTALDAHVVARAPRARRTGPQRGPGPARRPRRTAGYAMAVARRFASCGRAHVSAHDPHEAVCLDGSARLWRAAVACCCTLRLTLGRLGLPP